MAVRITVILITGVLFFALPAGGEEITLKTGRTVNARITARSGDRITIDFFGVPITYKADEIESIDGIGPTPKEKAPAQPSSSGAAQEPVMPDFEGMLASARKTASDARRLFHEARYEEAAQKLDEIWRLSDSLSSQRDFAFTSSVAGLSAQDIAFPVAKEMLESNRLNPASLGILSDGIKFLKRSRDGLEEAFRLENEASKRAVSAISQTLADEKTRAKGENYFKILSSEYNRFSDEICAGAIEALDLNEPGKVDAKTRGLPKEIDPRRIDWEAKVKANEPGKMAKKLCGAGPDYGMAIKQYYIQSARIDLIDLAIALTKYKIKEGHFPEELADLASAYIDSVPRDPFDRFKPMKYECVSGSAAVSSDGYAGSRIAIYLKRVL